MGDRSSYFSAEVWSGVIKANRESADSPSAILWTDIEPILGQDYDRLEAQLRRSGWGRCNRSPTRTPIPLQLQHAHDPDPKRLHDHIRRILDLFDVWGIIASASAGQVKPLRDALYGIDIPLLVTTDSTTVDASHQLSNELRLMPSNQAQATAMLFKAIRAEGASRAKPLDSPEEVLLGMPFIAYSCDDMPQAREYVSDLREQLLAEAARLEIPIDQFSERHDHPGPLIVIGYGGHADNIIESRDRNRLTILSDGCATQAIYDAVLTRRDADTEYWFVTRPDVTLKNLGGKSFAAITEAGRKLLTWDARSPAEASLPRTSRRDIIKNILEETDKAHFSFDGIENVALAYRVIPMSYEADLARATPPQTPIKENKGDDEGPRLRLVGT